MRVPAAIVRGRVLISRGFMLNIERSGVTASFVPASQRGGKLGLFFTGVL